MKKLISINKNYINSMNYKEVLKEMDKATYYKVFTDKTWDTLCERLDYLHNETENLKHTNNK